MDDYRLPSSGDIITRFNLANLGNGCFGGKFTHSFNHTPTVCHLGLLAPGPNAAGEPEKYRLSVTDPYGFLHLEVVPECFEVAYHCKRTRRLLSLTGQFELAFSSSSRPPIFIGPPPRNMVELMHVVLGFPEDAQYISR